MVKPFQGVMKHSSTPDVPGELREPEVLSAPMEMLEEVERAKIYAERTKRVREYCKYMPNDTMIDEWKTGSGNSQICYNWSLLI